MELCLYIFSWRFIKTHTLKLSLLKLIVRSFAQTELSFISSLKSKPTLLETCTWMWAPGSWHKRANLFDTVATFWSRSWVGNKERILTKISSGKWVSCVEGMSFITWKNRIHINFLHYFQLCVDSVFKFEEVDNANFLHLPLQTLIMRTSTHKQVDS